MTNYYSANCEVASSFQLKKSKTVLHKTKLSHATFRLSWFSLREHFKKVLMFLKLMKTKHQENIIERKENKTFSEKMQRNFFQEVYERMNSHKLSSRSISPRITKSPKHKPKVFYAKCQAGNFKQQFSYLCFRLQTISFIFTF